MTRHFKGCDIPMYHCDLDHSVELCDSCEDFVEKEKASAAAPEAEPWQGAFMGGGTLWLGEREIEWASRIEAANTQRDEAVKLLRELVYGEEYVNEIHPELLERICAFLKPLGGTDE